MAMVCESARSAIVRVRRCTRWHARVDRPSCSDADSSNVRTVLFIVAWWFSASPLRLALSTPWRSSWRDWHAVTLSRTAEEGSPWSASLSSFSETLGISTCMSMRSTSGPGIWGLSKTHVGVEVQFYRRVRFLWHGKTWPQIFARHRERKRLNSYLKNKPDAFFLARIWIE